jgi:hypothetical protein
LLKYLDSPASRPPAFLPAPAHVSFTECEQKRNLVSIDDRQPFKSPILVFEGKVEPALSEESELSIPLDDLRFELAALGRQRFNQEEEPTVPPLQATLSKP